MSTNNAPPLTDYDNEVKGKAIWLGPPLNYAIFFISDGAIIRGYKFDPSQTDDHSGKWLGQISTTNAPAAYAGTTKAWTGQKYIVWGGFNNSLSPQESNLGALYDPWVDQWTTMTTLNAPSARTTYADSWMSYTPFTGSLMPMWGGGRYIEGSGNTSVYNDGALYAAP